MSDPEVPSLVPNVNIDINLQLRTYVLLLDTIQHRVFIKIMEANGISEHENCLRNVNEHIRAYEKKVRPHLPAIEDALLYQAYVNDPECGRFYEDQMTSRRWDLAIEASRYYEQAISADNPQNQEAAEETARKCVIHAFEFESKFTQLLPKW